MGIFSFFKNLIKTENKEKELGEKEKFNFNEIDSYITKLKEEKKEKEKEVLKRISLLVTNLTKELGEKKEVIKKIDLKDKKEQEKIKLMVLDGLSVYSEQVERLIDSLESVKMDNLQKNIAKLNIIFDDFSKKSRMSYEKATILIGREMATIKDSLREFFNELGVILEENKELIKTLEIIDNVEIKISKVRDFEKEREEIQKSRENIEKDIAELRVKEKAIADKIEEIKKSPDYILTEKKRQEAFQIRMETEKEILTLKNMIDFRELEKTFHSDAKKMKIIKKYKEDFDFEENNELISLMDKKDEINQIITKIKENKKKSEEILSQKDDVKAAELELAYSNTQIERFNSEKEKEEKRIQKNQENLDWIKKEISEDLEYIR